jgi:hypothetical protein
MLDKQMFSTLVTAAYWSSKEGFLSPPEIFFEMANGGLTRHDMENAWAASEWLRGRYTGRLIESVWDKLSDLPLQEKLDRVHYILQDVCFCNFNKPDLVVTDPSTN